LGKGKEPEEIGPTSIKTKKGFRSSSNQQKLRALGEARRQQERTKKDDDGRIFFVKRGDESMREGEETT